MQQTEEKKNVFLTREFVLGGTIPLDFSKKIKFFQKLFFNILLKVKIFAKIIEISITIKKI